MADENGKIVIKPKEILTKHKAWATGESSNASSASTRREAIRSYAESTRIENKALSQFRAGLKIKNEGKRKDWLRSLQLLLPVAEAEIFGNEPDMFNGPDDDETDDTGPDDETDRDLDTEVDPDTLIRNGDPELADEAAEFEAQADSVMTPIDFGGKQA
tara:strand:+ start:1078 stop:1554 length:477 start_codon:yes stop_codon:yes gene_type:complete